MTGFGYFTRRRPVGCNANRRLCLEHCSFSVDATNRLPDGGYNLTPLDWARGRGRSAVVRLLEDD